jgi:two-component system response regulator YesN
MDSGCVLWLEEEDAAQVVQHTTWLEDYIHRVFFYFYTPERKTYDLGKLRFMDQLGGPVDDLAKEMGEGAWLIRPSTLQSLVECLIESRYPGSKLYAQVAAYIDRFKRLLGNESAAIYQQALLVRPPSLKVACHVMEQLQQMVRKAMTDAQENISDQMALAVLRAIRLLQDPENLVQGQQEVAQTVGVSRSYFSKAFREMVGISFSSYLKEARIAHAKELLRRSDDPIYLIASACGFEDERYFSQVFSEHVGISPTQYRSGAQA